MDPLEDESASPANCFRTEAHIRYFAQALHDENPPHYSKLDANRLTLAHFAVQALDLLGVWDNDDDEQLMAAVNTNHRLDKQRIIDWVYSLQVPGGGGFLGSSYAGPFEKTEDSTNDSELLFLSYHQPHIAMDYCALCILCTLGDDLSRLNKSGMLRHAANLQRSDGSFRCTNVPSEHDMRFLYCACAISYMLQDWSWMDRELAVEYVQNCRAWDGGIALIPGQEGHGGSTFCGLAALVLMDRAEQVLSEKGWREELINWCVHRQVGGMQGRPGKAEDTCYSYWIGGALRLLGQDHLLDHIKLREFIFRCQNEHMGGFGKVVGAFPDILHSFYSLAWLSLSNEYIENDKLPIGELNCSLGIAQARVDTLPGRRNP